MRIYVTHIPNLHPRSLERVQNACRYAGAIRLGFRDMMRVTIGRSTQNLRIDSRAACRRVFGVFQNQHPGTFAHHEAVPTRVPGAGGTRGVVVALTQCLAGDEASDACTVRPRCSSTGFVPSDPEKICPRFRNSATLPTCTRIQPNDAVAPEVGSHTHLRGCNY